jgi:hypothetical protein
MASNFRISAHRKNNRLDLRLVGDFDGTSACELLNFLEEHCESPVRVCLQTQGLKEIYPFGVDTFRNNLYHLKNRPIRLVFAGKNASRIAPERNRFF